MKPVVKLSATTPIITEKSPIPEAVFGLTGNKSRVFLGKISSPGITVQHFRESQDVILYLPPNSHYQIEKPFILEPEEALLVPIPEKIDRNEALIASSVALKLLNPLFQKGKFVSSESVLVLGLPFSMTYILIQLVSAFDGDAMVVMETAEELDRIRRFVEEMEDKGGKKGTITVFLKSDPFWQVITERTQGIGVDIILDYLQAHTQKEIKDIIGLLAPNGRWVINDRDIELTPPEIKSLFFRNASVGFAWEEVYGYFKFEIGKVLNAIEEMMRFVAEGKIRVVIDGVRDMEEWDKGVQTGNEKKLIGSVVLKIGEK